MGQNRTEKQGLKDDKDTKNNKEGVEEETMERKKMESVYQFYDSFPQMADLAVGSNQRLQNWNKHIRHWKVKLCCVGAPWQLSIWKGRGGEKGILWRKGRHKVGVFCHWCYGTAVNKQEWAEQMLMAVGREARREWWGYKDNVSLTEKVANDERKWLSRESQWNVMLLSLTVRGKSGWQSGSDKFVSQHQFSPQTTQNLFFSPKHAINSTIKSNSSNVKFSL